MQKNIIDEVIVAFKQANMQNEAERLIKLSEQHSSTDPKVKAEAINTIVGYCQMKVWGDLAVYRKAQYYKTPTEWLNALDRLAKYVKTGKLPAIKEDKFKYTCPVCGYEELEIKPYDSKGLGSTEMCQCCGFQFGHSDHACGVTHEEWRKVWIARGTPWSSRGYKPPQDWNGKEQLKRHGMWPFPT